MLRNDHMNIRVETTCQLKRLLILVNVDRQSEAYRKGAERRNGKRHSRNAFERELFRLSNANIKFDLKLKIRIDERE